MADQSLDTESAVMTPGPWELSDVRERGPRKVIHWTTNPNGHRWRRTVCVLSEGNMDEGEADVNAQAITALPDLLAALKEMRDATAAILRAIQHHDWSDDAIDDFTSWHRSAGLAGFGARADKAIAKAEGRA